MKQLGIIFLLFPFATICFGQQPRLVLPIGHTDYISNVYLSPDGKYIMSESSGQIMLWETKSGRLLQSIWGESTGGFTNKGTNIITYHRKADATSYIQLSDLISGKILDTIEGNFMKFNEARSHALITSDNGTLKYWDNINKKTIFKLKADLGTFVLDDNYIFTVNILNKDSEIYKFDIFELSTQIKIRSYQGRLSGISEKYICVEEDSVLRVYNLKTGDTLQTITLPKNEYYKGLFLHYNTKFSEDEKYMIAYEKDHSYNAILFDTDFKTSKTFTFDKQVKDIIFNPDGKSFIATSTFMDSIATAIDIKSNDTLFYLKGHKKYISDIIFSPDKKYILTGSSDATAILWDAHNGTKIRTFEGKNAMPVQSAISPDQKYLAYFVNNQLFVFEISNFRKVLSLPLPETDISFTSDSRHIILCRALYGSDGRPLLKKIDVLTGETICSFAYEQDNTSNYSFSKDGSLIGANPNNDEDAFVVYNEKKEKIVSIKSIEGSSIERVQFSSDNNYCIFLFSENSGKKNSISTMICYSVKDWKIIWKYSNHFIFDDFGINEKKKEIAFRTGISDISIGLLNLENGNRVDNNNAEPITGENHSLGQAFFFSPNGSVFSVVDDSKIRFYHYKTGKLILKHEFKDHIFFVHYFDEKKVLIGYLNGPIEFWDLETKSKTDYKKIDGRIVAFYGSNYIISDSYFLNLYDKNFNKLSSLMNLGTEDFINLIGGGYYQCTQNASRQLYYVTNDLKTIGFDQLDIKYNRPDKVLEAIGYKDIELINSYKKAYEKRIKKLEINTSAFDDGYSVPEADFVDRDASEFEQKKETLTLHIKGLDNSYKLDRFNVWVNDVPVFGLKGKSIRDKDSNTLDTTISIALSQGENRIETSIINANAIESYRMPLNVNYTPVSPYKEKTYFIGIGIDKFDNDTYNLKYSTKDIRDLANKLKEKLGDHLVIDTLFNKNVTVANVKALKQLLINTNVNDKVIISYSGHGVLSKDYDYFLSTYSIDFEKPEEKGLVYDELENLLDDIPARKKLMLIDACHSGEVDKEEMKKTENPIDESTPASTVASAEGPKTSTQAKGIIPIYVPDAKKIGMKNSFELMQELFVNVGRSTGATIISAAGGTQFALEDGGLKNGVFTYSILEFMKNNTEGTLSKLKEYVNKRVPELTKGMQVPTARTETNAIDWRVW